MRVYFKQCSCTGIWSALPLIFLRILGTLLNNSWHGTAASTGRGNSSSLLAARMLCLWLEATAGHGMNEDHSMPDGIGTWKLSCDTEFININMNTLQSDLGSQYSCPTSSSWRIYTSMRTQQYFTPFHLYQSVVWTQGSPCAAAISLHCTGSGCAVPFWTAITNLRWHPAPSCNSRWRKSTPETSEVSTLLSDWRHTLYNICILFNSARSSFLTNKTWRGHAYLVAALSVPSLWTVNNTQQIK